VVAPIEKLEDALASDLARERGMIAAIELDGRTLRAVGNPVRIAGMEQSYGPPPLLGEHGPQLLGRKQ
jgi:crotonobetainyl-CoA:carnitine CoA-transferase CaiB-like acyl-CoA transferase